VEGHDQLQCSLDQRCDDAPAGLQLAGVDARNDRQRISRLVEWCGALSRVQRQHDMTFRVELIYGELDPPVLTRTWDIDLRYRFTFCNPNVQGAGENAFDRDGLHEGNQLEVPLDARKIERQQILLWLDSCPTAKLVHRDNAVGLDVNLLDGECLVFIDTPAEDPFSGAIEQIEAKDGCKHGTQADRADARPRGADLAGTQLHVQHLLAAKSPVLWFTFEPHSAFA